MKNKKEKKKK